MERRSYAEEFKEQIVKECREVGNAALVARRHEVSPKTVANWLRKARSVGLPTGLPREKESRLKELERRLKAVSTENEQLKRLVAEKELEISILRELKRVPNPR